MNDCGCANDDCDNESDGDGEDNDGEDDDDSDDEYVDDGDDDAGGIIGSLYDAYDAHPIISNQKKKKIANAGLGCG